MGKMVGVILEKNCEVADGVLGKKVKTGARNISEKLYV